MPPSWDPDGVSPGTGSSWTGTEEDRSGTGAGNVDRGWDRGWLGQGLAGSRMQVVIGTGSGRDRRWDREWLGHTVAEIRSGTESSRDTAGRGRDRRLDKTWLEQEVA